MTDPRLTIFAGHYGSGKSNLAVTQALLLKKAHPGSRVIMADLDIVNPFLRSADASDLLSQNGIEVIASQFANSNLDAPAVPSGTQTIFDDTSCYAVMDIGGDASGAVALGQYASQLARTEYQALLVCNRYRPLSSTPELVRAVQTEIEAAAHFHFTGIVNNSNLGVQTTAEDVTASFDYIKAISALCGLPLAFTSVKPELLTKVSAAAKSYGLPGEVISLTISTKWLFTPQN
jgi:energy-coupling factor transporter ATP-binding protein EcfA2